jgi:hypothetical protein
MPLGKHKLTSRPTEMGYISPDMIQKRGRAVTDVEYRYPLSASHRFSMSNPWPIRGFKQAQQSTEQAVPQRLPATVSISRKLRLSVENTE